MLQTRSVGSFCVIDHRWYADHMAEKKKRWWLRILLGVVAVILVCALGVAGYLYVLFNSTVHGTTSTGELNLSDGDSVQDATEDILLVGTDSRVDAQGNPLSQDMIDALHAGDESDFTNTDTIILLRAPYNGDPAKAVSIPRDTYISTGQGNMKINGVYAAGEQAAVAAGLSPAQEKDEGRKALISTVQDLTGIHVDHYAEVGLVGFVLATDAVGGVDVCLLGDTSDEYSGVNLTAGEHTLNGADALGFVRQRHGLTNGDIDRITRQQAYLASMALSLSKKRTLLNPGTLQDLSDTVQRSLTLDPGWSVIDAAKKFTSVGSDVEFSTIPVTSIDGTGDKGESVVTVEPNQVRKYVKEQFQPEEQRKETHDYHGYSVEVVNAGSRDNLASNVAAVLGHDGANISGIVVKYGVVGQTSILQAKSPADPVAREMAEQLHMQVVADPSLSPTQIRVNLSDTYSGPTSVESEVPEDSGEAVGKVGSLVPDVDPVTTKDGIPCVN